MPFDRPTLAELVTRVRADMKGRLGIVGAIVRRSMANVMATVWAGAVHMLHGHLDWASLQIFADTAERENLLRIASFYSVTPTAATFASAIVETTGDNGSVIPEDTVLSRGDGQRYRVTSETTLSGAGLAFMVIEALEAGASANLNADDVLFYESPIAGVDSTVTLNTMLTDGVDEESTEALRARVLQVKRAPLQGGNDQDYEAWALAVAGVTRVWVYAHEDGLGTVTVRFVRDGDPDIFPSVGEVSDVQDALDEQRPITAEVTAAAPDPLEVDFTIELDPDTSEIRDAVEAELADLLFREGEPGDGAGRGTIRLSHIQVAVGTATGVDDFSITVPSADVVPGVGELAVMGTITWT